MKDEDLGAFDLIAFVPTAQPDRARDFYANVLGLRLVSEDAFALVFDAHGTMLRIAKMAQLQPAPYTVLALVIDAQYRRRRGRARRSRGGV